MPDGYPLIIDSIDWGDIFINAHPPTKIDIGCGRGHFLLEEAYNNPDDNVLGIEVRRWCCDWIRNYIVGESISNCGILRYCVANGLPFISDDSISEIFYLFPDPWVKTKHLKRRAFNIRFLEEVYRLLKVGGCLLLATDLLEVHQYHIALLKNYGRMSFVELDKDAS